MSWEDGSAGKETATNGWSLVTPWLAHAAVGLRWPGNEERTDAHRKATIRHVLSKSGRQRQREDHDRSQRKAALHHERSEAKQHADFFSLVIHRQTWRSSSKAHSPPLTVQTSDNPARKQSGGQYLTSTSQEDEEEGQPGNHPREYRAQPMKWCSPHQDGLLSQEEER